MEENAVLRGDDARVGELQGQGWRVVARSWGARLNAADVDTVLLSTILEHVRMDVLVRELEPSDRPAITALDDTTIGDYPGGVATIHNVLSPQRATVSGIRRGFGVITPDGEVIAMTFVDVDGTQVETDFTVVAKEWRGCGLATAVKAASVLALLLDGAKCFRTGGSHDNVASLAANTSLGYTIDEAWLTLAAPAL